MKLVSEVSCRRVELLIYTAFILGWSARNEGHSLDHPDNFIEIKNIISLIKRDPFSLN
jgi:hypothetical protein